MAAILFLSVPLGVLIVSDYRRREVSVSWLAASAAVSFFAAFRALGEAAVLGRLATNLSLLAAMYLLAGCYVCLVRRRAFGSFRRAIGAGDLLFLPVLSPFFELRGFVLFLTVSFVLSLLWYGVVFSMTKPKTRCVRGVPLVSTVGTCFFFYQASQLWIP